MKTAMEIKITQLENGYLVAVRKHIGSMGEETQSYSCWGSESIKEVIHGQLEDQMSTWEEREL